MRKCGFGGVDGKVRVDVEGGVGGIGRGAAAVLAAWRWKRQRRDGVVGQSDLVAWWSPVAGSGQRCCRRDVAGKRE